MQQRKLGPNGPLVGAVALGTMNFVGTYGPTTPEESLRCMDACLDMGINYFDTANVYGQGRAEELLSGFLRGNRDRVVLASKCGIQRNSERPVDNSPEHMRQALEGSLRRLGVDHIDLYYLHRHEPSRPIEDVMETFLRFRDEGKIGGIGLSEVAPSTIARAATVAPIAAVQSEYSLWTRLPELGVLQACALIGAAFVAFSPIGRGVFARALPDLTQLEASDFRTTMPRFDAQNWPHNRTYLRRFADYCADLGVSPASVAIAWVLARGPHVIALPGSRSVAHMQENAHGADLQLTQAQLEQIEAILPVGWAHGPRYGEAMARGPEVYC